MATTARIETKDRGPVVGMQEFLAQLLADEEIGAVLVPMHLQQGGTPMPTLVTDPAELAQADPLAPAFPLNGARMVGRLTHGRPGEKIAAVMRPCEVRAFIELVKLNQGSMDELVIIGVDCLGAYKNSDYFALLGEDDPIQTTLAFLGKTGGTKATARNGYDIARACRVCEFPVAEGADIQVGLFGVNFDDGLPVAAYSVRGEALLSRLGLAEMEPLASREQALREAVATRTALRDAVFKEVSAKTGSLKGLSQHLAGCVNCYNCRTACPVCYCKECVFLTDVFDHKPWQYMSWAKQRGMLKLPSDTVFFHLTRMAHMSTACVGCGQCSNACPNGIEVMELFRTVAAKTQAGFDYEPGRSLDEPPPLSVFHKNEFPEVAPVE
ncbi:MAG: 4Fe-4S dicluster domain-containing protein [Proteobacteria bacterium]|nr:4Fe-4S dicluster domain-containing protein [Pseudomonadota bacterium]MBU1611528.1 4Fe-4S dicluster domain-containing protein [Pseudomonadota bacterium]